MNNQQKSNPSVLRKLYTLLVSMKFAVIILILLGATSLFSMLINEYPAFFSKQSFLYTLFQQHSPYSSWWYSILLWFLIISVLLCVIQNTKPAFRSITLTQFLTTDNIKNIHNAKQIKRSQSNIAEIIKKLLKKQLYYVVESESNDEKLITARKFRWSSFGHLLTHISLLIIVLGSLIYTKTDRQEFRYIIAEEYKNTEYSENYPELFKWHFKVTETEHPTMVVDSFRVRYYAGNRGPSISDFRSYVRLFDHGGILLAKHEITVNNPLIYKHVSIHQSDYKPLVNEFFMNIPNRSQIVGRLQNNQEFERNETNWITGLSLRANKGKPVIFTGMLVSVVGLIMSFMIWPRNIWIAINKNTITLGGISKKNKIAFQKELDNIIKRISDE
ncbi:MAG: cytochrome c biogenesis protein ResB [Candidatus Marinimicrobia bacterium]|nr:cytochrome c biogenesis protein ResB [Candidatus Neomarinimicrobiota bacterium]